MKKITLLACACAMFFAPAVNAQDNCVEDPAQGYIFNRFQDNWFIEGMGGAGVMLSTNDQKADFGDRIGWKANLAVGKWFSPIVGLRVGAEINKMKGVAAQVNGSLGVRTDREMIDGKYAQDFNNIGAFGDAMINVTNWWCGYKPNRFYNAVVYAGMGIHWVYERENQGQGDWKYAGGAKHSRNFSFRSGLLNTFALSNHVNLLLDVRFDMLQDHVDGFGNRTWVEYPSVLLGLSYKFNKTEWNAPCVPVCPQVIDNSAEIEALKNKLAQANARIRDLEAQLAACLDRDEPPAPVAKEGPLATVYYQIGKSVITPQYQEVLGAVSEVMKNENKNYVLTGWADNYTGTDAINIKLRHDRVNGVKNNLVKRGIDASRLSAETNNENLVNLGPACAPLGRAVTIERAK